MNRSSEQFGAAGGAVGMMRRAAATMPRAASAGSAQPANGRHGAVGGLSAASELGVRADSDSVGSARLGKLV